MVFAVLFSTLVGVRTVPRAYVNAVRTLVDTRWTVIKDVLLPRALPNSMTGIRLPTGSSSCPSSRPR